MILKKYKCIKDYYPIINKPGEFVGEPTIEKNDFLIQLHPEDNSFKSLNKPGIVLDEFVLKHNKECFVLVFDIKDLSIL